MLTSSKIVPSSVGSEILIVLSVERILLSRQTDFCDEIRRIGSVFVRLHNRIVTGRANVSFGFTIIISCIINRSCGCQRIYLQRYKMAVGIGGVRINISTQVVLGHLIVQSLETNTLACLQDNSNQRAGMRYFEWYNCTACS